jgi:hypothetical protein
MTPYIQFVFSVLAVLPCPPELVEALQRIAGPNAQACGVLPFGQGQDISKAIACGNERMSSGKPFWLAVQVVGNDFGYWIGAAQAINGTKWLVSFSPNHDNGTPDSDSPQVVPCPGLEIAVNHREVIRCLKSKGSDSIDSQTKGTEVIKSDQAHQIRLR